MAGIERVINEEGHQDCVAGSEFKRKDTPSSYFITEFNVSTKKGGNSLQLSKGDARKQLEEVAGPSRKVSVNVGQGSDKKTEITVCSGWKKVDSWTQSDRNIVGQEESPPKERKKWTRPPVVGQAANISPPSLAVTQQTSSDSELDNKTRRLHISLGKATSYFDHFTGDKDYQEYRSKDEVPTTPESADCERVPSPASASSLTSRPLEWDSGADVGYNFASDPNDIRISTIEKLALAQGSSMIYKRSDPEGTTGNNLPNPNPVITLKIAPPVAESTPKNPDQKSDSESENPKPSRSKYEAIPAPLFPEVIVKTTGVVSDGSVSPEPPSRSKTQGNDLEEENIRKLSSVSLEEVGIDRKEKGEVEDSVSRSRSQNNLAEECAKAHAQRFLDSAKSRSSSSVSTVVNKKSSERSQGCGRGEDFEGGNRDSDDNRLSPSQGIPHQEDNLSRQTSPQGTDRFNTLESNPLTGEARVNSFEYLPGHVYENSVAKVDSVSSSQQSDVWEGAMAGTTLKEDVERGANLLAEFIRSSRAGEDTRLKKQLVKRVVEKLINSEYPDDVSIKSTRSSRDDMMMEYRGQISGESSTEKSDANQTPATKANKCVGTGISTSLSGYTETSEWNSASESSRKSTSDCQGAHFARGSARKVNKVTQVSVRDVPEINGPRFSEKRDSSNSKGEERKKKGSEEEMLRYLKKERRNQLEWIKSEIDHLSNLKKLLEKHEILKKNLDHLKRNRQTLERPLKSYSEQIDFRRRFNLKRDEGGVNSGQDGWKHNDKLGSNVAPSSRFKESGWTSHHYETDEELRPRKENVEPRISSLRRNPIRSMSNPLPRSTSYTITFPSTSDVKVQRRGKDDDVLLSVGELKSAIDSIVERHRKPTPVPNICQPTLKDCLECERPDFVEKAEARRQILSEIVQIRQERQDSKQQIIAAAASDIPGPKPPLAVKRVFSQKNLRKQTERKYKQLAEVRCKKAELKRKEAYRTNRLMADVFNKKLQRRTLQGQVNLSNSVCVTDPIK